MARLGVGKSGGESFTGLSIKLLAYIIGPGCRTCRRRKVKCDERKPGCERCERTNRECEGYVREHRFVNENARTEKQVMKKTNTSSDAPASHEVVSYSSEAKSGSIGTSLGVRAFEDNIFVSFLLSNLFTGIPVRTPWLHLHAEDASSKTAQLSVRALSTTFFGRIHHQKDITVRGYDLYGRALLSLNQDLQDPRKGWSMSVMKSAMALELYEVSGNMNFFNPVGSEKNDSPMSV